MLLGACLSRCPTSNPARSRLMQSLIHHERFGGMWDIGGGNRSRLQDLTARLLDRYRLRRPEPYLPSSRRYGERGVRCSRYKAR